MTVYEAAKSRTAELLRQTDLAEPAIHGNVMAECERAVIATALAYFKGNKLRTAKALGINRVTLRERIARYGIDA